MKYKTLLFDADNTLLDFNQTEMQAFEETMKKYGFPYDQEVKRQYDEINHGLWKRYEKGEITRDEVVNTRFGVLFNKIGVVGDGVTFEKEYQDMLGAGSFLMDGAITLLATVRRAGHKCYIVTNGVAKTQHRRLDESGIGRYVDGIFISEELECQKPAAEFFEKVFQAIGAKEEDKKDMLIIGDSLTSDISGGNNAGIATCWMNPNHELNKTAAKVDYEIAHLDQLYEILDIQ